jgi:TonB family protein
LATLLDGKMLDGKTQAERGVSVEAPVQYRQRRQMMVALGLLLAALLVVVVKDREFWFPSPPEAAEDSADEAAPAASTPSQPAVNGTTSAPQGTKSKPRPPARAEHEHISAVTPSAPQPSEPTIVATNRAALPPLEVEVVAGGQHTVLQPTNRSVRVDLQSGAPGAPVPGTMAGPTAPSSTAEPAAVATNAGERVRLSPDTAQMVERPVQPNYPMLAKAMKVQGSVVLQALIGQEGSIQDLRVLSGPAILSTAAMDAVRQWRFRPYFQSGQPIETEARITVNFTISTN